MTLWFKAAYVEPILSGAKTDTVRTKSRLQPGDVVAASVGPRPAFATLRITARRDIVVADIADARHRADVERLYPACAQFVELSFEVLT